MDLFEGLLALNELSLRLKFYRSHFFNVSVPSNYPVKYCLNLIHINCSTKANRLPVAFRCVIPGGSSLPHPTASINPCHQNYFHKSPFFEYSVLSQWVMDQWKIKVPVLNSFVCHFVVNKYIPEDEPWILNRMFFVVISFLALFDELHQPDIIHTCN